MTLPVFGLFLLAAALPAQASEHSVQSALADWRKQHGSNWEVFMDTGTGRASFLYGGSAPAPFEPASDADWFTLARGALAQTQALHGIEAATLVEHSTLFQPLGMVGSSDKQTVKFRQLVAGVPVDGGFVNVLFDARGRLLSVQTRALPGIAGLDVVPNYTADEAALRGVAQFQLDQGVVGSVSEEPELVVAQLEEAETRRGALAYRVSVLYLPADMEPLGTIYYFDAKSAEVLRRDDAIHNLDVGGRVYTMATPGSAPDIASNPETLQILKYARVQSSAGTVFTDANGDFNFVGETLPLDCTFTFEGTFNDVEQSAAASYALTATVPVGTGASVVLNPSADALDTAQANIFQSINVQRDWVRATNPLDGKADFVHSAHANIASSCNAFFSGSSINFYQAGSSCVNSGYSTVVSHEDGHWLNVVYGTGNGADGMGEGSADLWAMYVWDTPLVGEGFFTSGLPIRTGLNTRPFCGDCCSACYGSVHGDGEPWMGAGWKVRRNLKATHGTAAGGAVANALFLGWMNSYNQTQLKSVIESQWLVLDDNDGNLLNGTPNFYDIDAAFREQGFPGVTLIPLSITNVTPLPDTGNTVGPYVVEATIVSNLGASVAATQLHYRVGNTGPYTAVVMTPLGSSQYRAAIPGQPAPSLVSYYVAATDALGNGTTAPVGAPSQAAFSFCIGTLSPVFYDDFETGAHVWTVTSAAGTSGAWERGDPNGTTVNGVLAQPENDCTVAPGALCYFTGQGVPGSGNASDADVDGGPTSLTSPPLNLAGVNASLHYDYWLYNDDGDDSLLVQVATNAAGTNWVTVRTHTGLQGGWNIDTINLGTAVIPSATTRIRFRVADSPNNSVTEAAIDDVRVSVLASTGCTGNVQNYCAAKLNSEGCLPVLEFSGIPSLSSGAEFRITAESVLRSKTGMLFYGFATYAAPYQGGTMCIRAPLRRTPVQDSGGTSSNDCSGTYSYDMNARIRSGIDPVLVPGQFVATQYFYRDPDASFYSGLTNAVCFTICP
jgi:hypothetical protein